MEKRTTHFGFEKVAEEEKVLRVHGVFASVASRYDLMNDVMSFGIHRLWKSVMLDTLNLSANQTLLDVAGGTGDIAFGALKRQPTLNVTVCDINEAMLKEGRARAIDRNILQQIEWTCGNAEALPFLDSSFNRASIAFGIRNVTHIDAALREIFRCLKPGGKFVCLEFSKPAMGWLETLYDAYSFHLIPRFGQWITGDAKSYQYLVESIRLFPTQEIFADMLKAAGFAQVKYVNLSGGIVALHSGVKL